ncbi:MAG: DUF4234 domain-containing protein [FCB group bacterium]|jgi:hypothetical protein|nr:DUF4234 domain-containing protein [FCB group bacterium]
MTNDSKACPYCGEEILAVAKKCKHCQSMLVNTGIKKRDLGIIILLCVVTLGLYGFYLIPDFGRSVNAALNRRKHSFSVVLILGILTLGVALTVYEIIYAYDLERNGRQAGFGERVSSLGTYVLVLNIVSWIVVFMSGGVALIVSAFTGIWATWLVQKELNLLAEHQLAAA